MNRRLLGPLLSTLVMLAVLVGLGTWQMQRRAWKLGLLAKIEAAEQAAPVPLGPDLPPFAKVEATGTLRLDLAAGYGAEARETPRGTVLGTQLIVPLQREDGPPVLVDLGWLPEGAALPVASGPVRVTGYLRPADHAGWFTPADDPARRRFYALEPAAIGAALGMPSLQPFTLVAVGAAPPPGAPDPARHLPTLPNNHLQYAITWYSLALVLVAVFASWLRKTRRP